MSVNMLNTNGFDKKPPESYLDFFFYNTRAVVMNRKIAMDCDSYTPTPESEWEFKIRSAIGDPATCRFVKEALIYGYKNLKIKKPEDVVENIFLKLAASNTKEIKDVLEEIRNTQFLGVEGGSIRETWSGYYRDTEAPFIAGLISDQVVGNKILEVGTGRGWVSYHLSNLLNKSVNITQTDLFDYREPLVKEYNNFAFVQVNALDPLPFQEGFFDTAIIVYVLHHLDSEKVFKGFLCKLDKVVKHKIIILDDTYVASNHVSHFCYDQSPLIEQFQKLNRWQKICALTFSCSFSNRVDGGGKDVPPPNVFMEFDVLRSILESIFNKALIKSEYLGIPKTKVYLNSEGLFVVEK